MAIDGSTSYYAAPTGYTAEYILTGPDGNLWFNGIGNGYQYPQAEIQMTTTGVMTVFTNGFGGIAIAGPNGELWGTGSRMTTSGVVTQNQLQPGTVISGLTVGSDGNVWFADQGLDVSTPGPGASAVGRMTPDGVATYYYTANTASDVSHVTTGSDGNVWFSAPWELGTVTPAGVMSEYLLNGAYNPGQLAAQPGGNVWFIDGNTGELAEVELVTAPAAPTNLTATPPNAAPSLSWNTTPGATSYKVYRNGVVIGSTTSNTFTDTSAPTGSNSYYVTAVNAIGESAPSNSVTVNNIPFATSVTLSPTSGTGTVDSSATFTATATDGSGNGVANTTLSFSVSGSTTTTGTCVTNSAGQCSFSYTGPALPGADQINVYADNNNNGQQDTGEPTATATQSWVLPSSTPGTVTGGGTAPGSTAGKIAFGFLARSGSQVSGECTVVDPSAKIHITCTDVTVLVVNGNQATFFGDAVVNGTPTTYRVDVVGNAGPSQNTFSILTASGYQAGGAVTGVVSVR